MAWKMCRQTGSVWGIASEWRWISAVRQPHWSIGKTVRSGNAGQLGLEEAMPPCNFVCRPVGANPARPRVSPPELGARLALASARAAAIRRQANVWAMEHAAPKPLTFPDAQGPVLPEGNNHPLQELLGEEGMVAGGVCDPGTYEEEGTVTWEALASPRYIPVWRRAGAPSPT